MKETCFRCKGEGRLPQFSHIKGGVCFTCGGDGVVNTFSHHKLNRFTNDEEVYDYVHYATTRDLLDYVRTDEYKKLGISKQRVVFAEVERRAKDLGVSLTGRWGDKLLEKIEKAENAPKPWKKSPYYEAGKVAEVPVRWLTKFQGNNLRRNKAEMKKFGEQLLEEGLKDPIMVIIGQEDRKVSIGEGNHRTFAMLGAGFDKVPVRVVRQVRNSYGVYYDKMSRVPVDDYFPADSSPLDVFDTFYDGGDLPEPPKYDPEKEDGYTKMNEEQLGKVKNLKGVENVGLDISDVDLKGNYGINGLYSKDYNDKEEDVIYLKEIVKMLEDTFKIRGASGNEVYEKVMRELKKENVLKVLDNEQGFYNLVGDNLDGTYFLVESDYDRALIERATKGSNDDDLDFEDLDDIDFDLDI